MYLMTFHFMQSDCFWLRVERFEIYIMGNKSDKREF